MSWFVGSFSHYRGSFGTQANRQSQVTLTPDRPPPPLPPGAGRPESGRSMLVPMYFQRPSHAGDEIDLPFMRPASTASGNSGSRSSIFREHLEDLEEHYFRRPPSSLNSPGRSPRTPNSESPTLGRPGAASTQSLADDTRRRRHLLSWSSEDAALAEEQEMQGQGRAPPHGTTLASPGLNAPMDPKFVPRPLSSRRGTQM
jgi:hypothetical protein